MKTNKMISVPIAVHVDAFKWQLDLFWFNHQLTYPGDAAERINAVIVKRNFLTEPRHDTLEWPMHVPHKMCESMFDCLPVESGLAAMGTITLPLNIQIGLSQMLHDFDDDQIIEVLDCDMFHFRPAPEMQVGDDELYVCDLYENWHLKSQGEYKNVIERYFENDGGYYNGGFVPIIGKVRTFKKIMYEWIAVHIDILQNNWPDIIKWWAGMYALQAACEKAKVTMIAKDICYIPGANTLSDSHYISHYCVDGRFTKKTYPAIDTNLFEKNIYYDRILQWLPTQSALQETDLRARYLDLIERSLLGLIYEDAPLATAWSPKEFDPNLRAIGHDWPSKAHSMIGKKRMNNLRVLCEHVIRTNIPGDFIETGIWRGGACIMMRAVLQSHHITDRNVWCADSFEGLPKPDAAQYPKDAGDGFHAFTELAVSLEQVQANFRKYDLLDGQVKFLKGWFKDTLPTAPISKLAILRLDGDMYQSTMEALEALYPKLLPGGFVIVDDYSLGGCKQAIHDFRDKNGITDAIQPIDHDGVYWQKT